MQGKGLGCVAVSQNSRLQLQIGCFVHLKVLKVFFKTDKSRTFLYLRRMFGIFYLMNGLNEFPAVVMACVPEVKSAFVNVSTKTCTLLI